MLNQAMIELGWDYPMHLGVTEAGDGEDGRIKSGMGIGSLLLDGIGDTIRVSLTEDPWSEIDPCQRLIRLTEGFYGQGVESFDETHRSIEQIERRPIKINPAVPLHRDGTVFASLPAQLINASALYQEIGCAGAFGRPKLHHMTIDNLVVKNWVGGKEATQRLQSLKEIGIGLFSQSPGLPGIPILPLKEAALAKQLKSRTEKFALHLPDQNVPTIVEIQHESAINWKDLLEIKPDLIIFCQKKIGCTIAAIFLNGCGIIRWMCRSFCIFLIREPKKIQFYWLVWNADHCFAMG